MTSPRATTDVTTGGGRYGTGGDAVKSIIPRWCGWKKCEDVFVRDFYNVLMPQRPTSV